MESTQPWVTMTCDYECQFYIDEVQVFFYLEDGKRFKGWSFDRKVYSTGNPIWREEVLQDVSSSSVTIDNTYLYYIMDANAVPVGSLRDRDYGFLGKHNIIFPRELHFNGYEFWSEAEYALDRIENYYRRLKQCKMTIKNRANMEHMFKKITLTEEALRRRNTEDTFGKGRREKPSPNSLIGILASLEEED